MVEAKFQVLDQRIQSFHCNNRKRSLSGDEYNFGKKMMIRSVRGVDSRSGNVMKGISSLAKKLSWKWKIKKHHQSFWFSISVFDWFLFLILTTSREFGCSAMRVVMTSRSFLSWRSDGCELLSSWKKNASFRDLRKKINFYKKQVIQNPCATR